MSDSDKKAELLKTVDPASLPKHFESGLIRPDSKCLGRLAGSTVFRSSAFLSESLMGYPEWLKARRQ